MSPEQARCILLSLPGAVEGSHHGHPDFRYVNKIFATLWPADGRAVLRLSSGAAEVLALQEPDRYAIHSRSANWYWLSVSLDHVDEQDFVELAETARRAIKLTPKERELAIAG
ncbi:MAG: MmcQ/YjbR family DNA-binding protein [Armatimonadetes bacterium]|nr:MmcQ/YjbR family DNA-binding protein [Armatimonadota bacterium]